MIRVSAQNIKPDTHSYFAVFSVLRQIILGDGQVSRPLGIRAVRMIPQKHCLTGRCQIVQVGASNAAAIGKLGLLEPFRGPLFRQTIRRYDAVVLRCNLFPFLPAKLDTSNTRWCNRQLNTISHTELCATSQVTLKGGVGGAWCRSVCC